MSNFRPPPPPPPPFVVSTSRKPADDIRVLSRQGGAVVLELDDDLIIKAGERIQRNEEVAMRLVSQHTNVPVPEVIFSAYHPDRSDIGMSLIPGSTLQSSWNGLDEPTKERLCRETWDMITKFRQIPKPDELSHLFQCGADGSPTHDPLIKGLEDPPPPLLDDAALRARIEQRYLHFCGRRYANELASMLPRSDGSVFTHGDIAPRNIMVGEDNRITGIIDWESAGWYPDYWEYANIMRPQYLCEDWQAWMEHTAPQKWDLAGIKASRRVLF